MDQKNKLYIASGLPGSGKSTLTKTIASKRCGLTVVLSTDQIFMSPTLYPFIGKCGVVDGEAEYLWTGEAIREAHHVNLAKCKVACLRKIPTIIIDNTNLGFNECKPYCELALANDYEVEFVEPNTPWKNDPEECFKRNTHDVPLEVIRRMASRYESLDVKKLKFEQLKEGFPV